MSPPLKIICHEGGRNMCGYTIPLPATLFRVVVLDSEPPAPPTWYHSGRTPRHVVYFAGSYAFAPGSDGAGGVCISTVAAHLISVLLQAPPLRGLLARMPARRLARLELKPADKTYKLSLAHDEAFSALAGDLAAITGHGFHRDAQARWHRHDPSRSVLSVISTDPPTDMLFLCTSLPRRIPEQQGEKMVASEEEE